MQEEKPKSTKQNKQNCELAVQTRSKKTLKDCNICYSKIDVQGKIDCCAHVFCYKCIKKWSKVSISS